MCALRGALALSGGASAGAVTEQPGDQVGPYTLVRKLGEGGYGIVYLAEQTEPLRRRVALKVIKPGMDSRQVIAMRKKLLGNEHPLLATTLGNLGTALWYENKFPEAETAYRETLSMQRKLMGEEHPDVATSPHNLVRVLQSEGKVSEAEPLYRQALEMRKKLLGPEHPDTASTATALAAIAALRDMLPGQPPPPGPEHPEGAVSPKKEEQ